MEKNKTTIAYILLLTLLLGIVYFISKKENGFSRTDRRDFAVSDTSEVVSITLTSKVPESAILNRVSENLWTVNNRYKASKSKVFNLLKTIQRMEISHPVPLSMKDNVLGNLAIHSIKVKVELNNGKKKIFYVGGNTPEQNATFMMMQGATEPYAVHIPGFNGYLSSRFFTQEYIWRDKIIMSYDNRDISSIEMEYSNPNKSESFQVNIGEQGIELFSFGSNKPTKANNIKIKEYLSYFRKLPAESFIAGNLNTDSILKTKFIFNVKVKNFEQDETNMLVFPMKNSRNQISLDNDMIPDPERLFAFVNEKDWMIIQLNTFKKIMKKLSDLRE